MKTQVNGYNMTTGIKRVAEGKYQVIVGYDTLNGERKYHIHGTFNSRKDASEERFFVQDLIDHCEYEIYIEDDVTGVTLSECIEKALEDEYKRGLCKQKSTYNNYNSIYNKHIKNELGSDMIRNIKTSDLQKLIDEKGNIFSKSTVKLIKIVIKKGVDYALRNDIIERDISRGLKEWGQENKEDKEDNKKTIDVELLKRVFKETKGTELGLQILMGSTLGLRLSEILALSWDNIDLDEKSITVSQIVSKDTNGEIYIKKSTKNSEKITVSIPEILCDELKVFKKEWNKDFIEHRMYNKENLLFVDNKYKPVKISTISNRFSRLMKKYGCKTTFHNLRHTYASMLFNEGLDIKTISQLLNHKSISVTESVYIHLLENKMLTDGATVVNTILGNVVPFRKVK